MTTTKRKAATKPLITPAATAHGGGAQSYWRPVSGIHRLVLRALIWCQAIRLALRKGCLFRALRAAQRLRAQARARGFRLPARSIRAAGRYYSGLYTPGWPSPAFDRHLVWELNQAVPTGAGPPVPQVVVMAITKRCPLRCQHCLEWVSHNRPETVPLERLVTMVARFQALGVSQIQFTGGEPLCRFSDLLSLLRSAGPGTDFWVITSGFQLTRRRARMLAEAGLTGVIVSLDHWDPAHHDAFRGLCGSYDWTQQAARNARRSGLLVALSLCAMPAFVDTENLRRYVQVARRMGAAFIQLLEPRSVGRLAGQDVTLSRDQLAILESFYTQINLDVSHGELPLVEYPGLINRQVGCHGAGLRYLYVDTDGDIHPCPFSKNKVGTAIGGGLDQTLATLQRRGCGACAAAAGMTSAPAADSQTRETGGADEDPVHGARTA